jgi:hypothetical protein
MGASVQIEAGRPFVVDFGFFGTDNNAALGAGTVAVSIAADPSNPAESFTVGNSPTGIIAPSFGGTTAAIGISWNTAGLVPKLARLTLFMTDNPAIASTTITVQIVPQSTTPGALAFSTVNTTDRSGLPNLAVANSVLTARVGLFSATGSPLTSLTNLNVRLSASSTQASVQIDPGFSLQSVLVNQQFVDIPFRVFITGTGLNLIRTEIRAEVVPNPLNILATVATVILSTSGTQPIITSFTPTNGPGGSLVSIQGSNLGGVTTVSIGGVPATIVSTSPGQITVQIGAATCIGQITVSGTGGSATSAGSFANTSCATSGVTITSFSPNQGGMGTLINIVGTSLSGITSVTVAGLPAVVVSNSATAAQVRLTGSSTGTFSGPIRIVTPQGGATSAGVFTYILPPVINSITPSSFIANGTSIGLVIDGSSFSTANVSPEQFFVDVNGQQFGFALVPTTRTSNQITFAFPGLFNLQPGPRLISVRNVDGQVATVPITLLPAPAPVFTSATPTSTTATGSPFTVTIAGRNFFAPVGLSVSVSAPGISNGAPVQPVYVLNATRDTLRLQVPSEFNFRGNTLNIGVRNADGQGITTQVVVNAAPAPTITTLSPNRINVGSPTTRVVIIGSGFFPNALFRLGSTVAIPPVSASATQAVIDIPASFLAAARIQPIVVENPDGQTGTAILNITLPSPTITDITPSTNASQFGYLMTISGTNYRAGATVTYNNTPLVVRQLVATQIIAQVPASLNVSGVHFITVTNVDDNSAFGSTTATIRVGTSTAPLVNSINPPGRPADGSAFNITITGNNFATAPFPTVTFGGVPLQITSVTPTQIVASVPGGLNIRANMAIPVQVTNPDGQTFTVVFSSVAQRLIGSMSGKLFPNPVSDVFTVETEVPRPSLVTLRLSDPLGRTVLEFRENAPAGVLRKQIDVGFLPAGVYLFEIIDGDRRMVEKVVKN